ncbi:unnamed protein product, partial [Rotaria magnacalcarata]
MHSSLLVLQTKLSVNVDKDEHCVPSTQFLCVKADFETTNAGLKSANDERLKSTL